MVSIKKIFGSSDDKASHEPNDLAGTGTSSGHAYSSGKETEAHRKNDELARGETPLNNQNRQSSEGYNTNNTTSSTTGVSTGRTLDNTHSNHDGKGAFNQGLDNVGSHRGLVGSHPQEEHPSGARPEVNVLADERVHASKGAQDHILRTDHGNSATTSAPLAQTSAVPVSTEKTGAGRLSSSSSGRGFGDQPHESGHHSRGSTEFDPKLATHDHQHLQHVVHKDVRHVEVEEVERTREVDRHIHHVQTHVQPVLDKQVLPEKIHENLVAPTQINEKHASTAEDVALFASLASQHKDTEVHRGKERTVVDLGERVHENVYHHVHHVTQPVIEQEIVERHRIHTVIPVHHVTHEAPIIHKSSTHAPVSLNDFLQGGGKLDSHITHESSGLLANNDCERVEDGPATALVRDLHLSDSHYGSTPTSFGAGRTTRRPGHKLGRSGSMSSVSSSDEDESGVRTSRAQKREKRRGLFSSKKDKETNAARV